MATEKRMKVVIKSYPVKIVEDGKEKEVPYNVKKSLSAVLFGPNLNLAPREAVRNDALASKIEQDVDSILLSLEDYAVLRSAIESFTDFDRNSVELIHRVIDAEEVSVGVNELKDG